MELAKTSAEPFGTYRLPGKLEAFRRGGNTLPDSFLGRRMASLIRKLCLLLGGDGPFDIPVFERQNARVYPRSNRCEKRAFSGLRSWDRAERAFLGDAIAKAADEFVFVDAGANVGFYSLFVVDACAQREHPVKALAIEPDPINRARLTFNIVASHCHNVAICPDALGGNTRMAELVDHDSNRGEVRLGDTVDNGWSKPAATQVRVRPLVDVLAEHDVTRIDALKLDIEGVEHETLDAFFANAGFDLWPELIVLEVGRSGTSDAYELCRRMGYEPVMSARINSILRRPASPPAMPIA